MSVSLLFGKEQGEKGITKLQTSIRILSLFNRFIYYKILIVSKSMATEKKKEAGAGAVELIRLAGEPYPTNLKAAKDLLERFDAALDRAKQDSRNRQRKYRRLLRGGQPSKKVEELITKEKEAFAKLLNTAVPFREGLAARAGQLDGEGALKESQRAREQRSGLSLYA